MQPLEDHLSSEHQVCLKTIGIRVKERAVALLIYILTLVNG